MPDALEEAERLFSAGNNLSAARSNLEALDRFQTAWSVLPPPREEQYRLSAS
jgi:hypothetical protein